MKKKIFFRILSGFFIGLSIGYLITIILSLIWGKGYYSPCVPELIGITGSEIKAVLLQASEHAQSSGKLKNGEL